jgi:hypothetical protein
LWKYLVRISSSPFSYPAHQGNLSVKVVGEIISRHK